MTIPACCSRSWRRLRQLPGHELRAADEWRAGLPDGGAQGGVDLLVTDVVMDPMDGLSLRNALLRGFPEPAHDLHFGLRPERLRREIGETPMLAKPLDVAVLLETVQGELAKLPPAPAPGAGGRAGAGAGAGPVASPPAERRARGGSASRAGCRRRGAARAVPVAKRRRGAGRGASAARPPAGPRRRPGRQRPCRFRAQGRAGGESAASPSLPVPRRPRAVPVAVPKAARCRSPSEAAAAPVARAVPLPAAAGAALAVRHPPKPTRSGCSARPSAATRSSPCSARAAGVPSSPAVQVAINRRVGLKVLDPELAAEQEHRDRFIADARAKANVQHPSILSVYEAGSADSLDLLHPRVCRRRRTSPRWRAPAARSTSRPR